MPTTTRNSCFFRGIASVARPNVEYTVPAATNVIFKHVALFNAAAAGGHVNLYVVAGDASSAFYLVQKDLAVAETFQLETWLCLNPGDKLQFAANNAGVAFWCSGAKLTPAA